MSTLVYREWTNVVSVFFKTFGLWTIRTWELVRASKITTQSLTIWWRTFFHLSRSDLPELHSRSCWSGFQRWTTMYTYFVPYCTTNVVTETETNQIEPDCMCELHNNSASSRIISLTMATRESEYYRDCNHNSVGLHFRPRESSCKKHTIHLQIYVLLYLWLHIPCMMQFLYKLGLHGDNNVDVSKLNCLFNTIMIICCNRFLSAWVEKRKNTMWWYLVQNSNLHIGMS
jgi:hypothetical protein